MVYLVSGIVLWIGIHLIPSVGLRYKEAIVERIGLMTYRACFALSILGCMALIIIGWQTAQPVSVYIPPYELRWVTIPLVVLAFVLLGATGRPSRIGRLIRFPQLTAVILWAAAHLLANGDSRSLVLFIGMALWAIIMMIVMSRRDTHWENRPAPSWPIEITGIGVMLLVALGVIVVHPHLTGMPVL